MSRKILLSVIASVINVSGGLIRNKIFAAYLSVNLFGILSIGQQSVSLLFTLFVFGLPLGITTYAANLLNRPHEEQVRAISRILVLALGLALLFGGLLALILTTDPYFVSRAVSNSDQYALVVAIILISAPLMLIETCLFSVFEGMGNLRAIVIFRIIPAVVTLPIIYFLVSSHHLLGAAIGLVVHEFILVITSIFLLRRMIAFSSDALRVGPVFRKVFKVALLSFLVGAVWFVVDFAVKRWMLSAFGEVDNGIVQSVAKISEMYPTIALSWLTMHLFPVMATMMNDRAAVVGALERTVLVAVAMVVPIILLLFVFRELVLEILYKKEFILAVGYFGAMLVPGISKVYSWVLGAALLPLGWKKEWFRSSLFLIALYALIVVAAVAMGAGIYAIPIALGLGQILQGVFIIMRLQSLGYQFNKLFWVQTTYYVVLTMLLFGALFWFPFVAVAGVVYLVFVHRFNLISEVIEKLIGLGKKTVA